MSWAAANLIKKSRKEKENKIVRKSEELEWERHPPASPPGVLPCSELAQLDSECQASSVQAIADAVFCMEHPGCLTHGHFLQTHF